VSAAKLAQANSRMEGIRVGNFSPCASPLRLGDLSGNLFTIVLRAVDGGSTQHATAAVSALRESGFVNYFGLQRFGTGTVATHTVGVCLP
jgi:tRNA pseudouridine13 synthase